VKQIGTAFLVLAGIVAAVPGLRGIQSGVGTPPTHGELFGSVSVACGALCILGLYLFRAEVRRLSRRTVVLATSWALVGFFLTLATYLLLLSLCTVRVEGEEAGSPDVVFYFPLWPGGLLSERIEATSRQDVANRYRRAMPDLLEEQGLRLTSTTVVLMLCYVLCLTSLTFSFGFLGMRIRPPSARRVDASRRVFVAYAREDKAIVHEIVNDLEAEGFKVRWDDDLTSGRWRDALRAELRAADQFLWVMSSASEKSVEVRTEFDIATGLGARIHILALASATRPTNDVVRADVHAYNWIPRTRLSKLVRALRATVRMADEENVELVAAGSGDAGPDAETQPPGQ